MLHLKIEIHSAMLLGAEEIKGKSMTLGQMNGQPRSDCRRVCAREPPRLRDIHFQLLFCLT